jgi:hypothetical protein
VDRAQNDIASVAVVLHQSGFPQIPHGRFFETLLYSVAIIPDLFRTPMNCLQLVFTGSWLVSSVFDDDAGGVSHLQRSPVSQ